MSRAINVAHLRPSVAQFAIEMENALRKHDNKKGGQDNWRNDPPRELMRRMLEEAIELDRELDEGGAEQIVKEAADVANFAMMVADASEHLAEDVESRCSIRCCPGWATRVHPDESGREVCEWHHNLAVEIEDALAKRAMKGGAA